MSGLHASLRVVLAAALIAACGGTDADRTAEAPPDTSVTTDAVEGDAARTDEDPSDATLLTDGLPSGSPMPATEEAGGIPPYPDAVVHNRTRTKLEGMRAFEAFSADPVEEVIAFYERRLSSWRRVEAEDTDVWVLDPDQAAVTVSEWEWENAHPDLPRFLREDARTVIGAAWRIDEAGTNEGAAPREPRVPDGR